MKEILFFSEHTFGQVSLATINEDKENSVMFVFKLVTSGHTYSVLTYIKVLVVMTPVSMLLMIGHVYKTGTAKQIEVH